MKIFENGKTRNATKKEAAALSAFNPYEGLSYQQLVVAFIRDKYTLDDELAIHRQRDTKPEEFAEYNAFCEECKAKAKQTKEETA